jgi:hypothetical protein
MTDQPYDYDKLRQRAEKGEDRPDAWRAVNEGDEVFGRVLRFEQRSSQYGPASYVILATPSGMKSAGLFGVLEGMVRERNVQVSDQLFIRYKGLTTGANGRSYKDYIVEADPDRRGSSSLAPARAPGRGDGYDPDSQIPADDDWMPPGFPESGF